MRIKGLTACFLLTASLSGHSQVPGFFDDFEDGSVDTVINQVSYTLWKADHPRTFGITESEGVLNIAYTRTAESAMWDNFHFTPPEPVDVSANPQITLKIRSDVSTVFTVKPIYSNGNDGWIQKSVPADDAWHTYVYELEPGNYPGGTLDKIYLYFDGGSTDLKSGTVRFDDFQVAGFSLSVEDLKASVVDSSSVLLSWRSSDPVNTLGFSLYRNRDAPFTPDPSNRILETTDTTFLDTGLIPRTTYHYLVSATDTEGREHPPAPASIRLSTPGAVPEPKVVSSNSGPVGMYEKFELVVEMPDATYTNPYDPEEIDLFAWFRSPEGDSVRINGFYDNYLGRDQWKIRFSPDKPGTWSYLLGATDSDGTGRGDTGSFQVSATDHKGWIRISPGNPDYFIHDDGTPFYGLAVYYPWNVTETGLDRMADAGVNLFGYWDCTFDHAGNGGGAFLLESMESGIGKYDQRKAARIDQLLEWSEARDLKVMLAIWTHPYLRISGVPWDDGRWNANNPYSTLVEADEFYTDAEALAYQDKHHRYLIARYGYSRSLGIWELINEIHGTSGWVASESDAKNWVRRTHAFFKKNDPYKRATTASFGGGEGASHIAEDGSLGDISNVHFYEQHGWPNRYPENVVRSGLANVVSETRKLKEKGERPAFFGEAGYYTMLADAGSQEYTWEFRNAMWAGLANGMASTPFWWEFNKDDIFTPVRLQAYGHLARFVSGIDLANTGFRPSEVQSVSADGYLMSAGTSAFGWLKRYDGSLPAGDTVVMPRSFLENGSYRLRWYDTWAGAFSGPDTLLAVDRLGWSTLPPGWEREDAALRIEPLQAGGTATTLHLELVSYDTVVPNPLPWLPGIDSAMHRIACYVTGDEGLMDTSFYGPVTLTFSDKPGPRTIELEKGGRLIPLDWDGSSRLILDAQAEGLESALLEIGTVTGTDLSRPGNRPPELSVAPNPVRYRAVMEVTLESGQRVDLALFDIQGQRVATLRRGFLPAGHHRMHWDNPGLSPGIYLVRLEGSGHRIIRKLSLAR